MIQSGWLSTLEIEAFATKAKLWLELFLQVYQTKHMTPYMHALVAHLPEFLTLHGSIIPFMQQGLERLNDQYTHFYFRGTNHHDYEALKQLLLKKNCIECLSDEGCMWQRKQQVQVCSCCGKCGHTKRPALRVTKTSAVWINMHCNIPTFSLYQELPLNSVCGLISINLSIY